MDLFSEIKRQAEPLMIAFQSDLEHDKAWLKDHPGVPFIHVTRKSGTHIFPIPEPDSLLEDKRVPHLFGEARQSEVYRQIREFLVGDIEQSGRLWLHFDGKRLVKRGPKACVAAFDRGLGAAVRRSRAA